MRFDEWSLADSVGRKQRRRRQGREKKGWGWDTCAGGFSARATFSCGLQSVLFSGDLMFLRFPLQTLVAFAFLAGSRPQRALWLNFRLAYTHTPCCCFVYHQQSPVSKEQTTRQTIQRRRRRETETPKRRHIDRVPMRTNPTTSCAINPLSVIRQNFNHWTNDYDEVFWSQHHRRRVAKPIE